MLQPAGTVRLMRKYNPAATTTAIFPRRASSVPWRPRPTATDRFVTSADTYRHMVANGWVGEGVAFSSPES